MFDHERTIYAAALQIVEMLTADIADDELSRQPVEGMNPPRWILGHLAIATDFCLRLLGRPPALPAEWHETFGPGSGNDGETGPRPTTAKLLTSLQEGHTRVLAALDEADEAALSLPHGVTEVSISRLFPTRGELLSHLMTSHESFHLGQLSAWRRATGRAAMF